MARGSPRRRASPTPDSASANAELRARMDAMAADLAACMASMNAQSAMIKQSMDRERNAQQNFNKLEQETASAQEVAHSKSAAAARRTHELD